MADKTEQIASKYLGKKIDGSETYNPALLVAVPRKENRLQYNIDVNKLPFYGYDVWHAYEFSSMTKNGLPVTKLLKIKYSCESECIVESKSLKLYLNSFNLEKYGSNMQECLNICKSIIKKDLKNLLKTDIELDFIDNRQDSSKIFQNFENIINYIDENSLTIEKFKEAPEVLETENTLENKEHYIHFDSLRSNCRVTHQPDFGDVFIYYKSNKHIKEASLVKYLCSFRSEYHFHEECCEMIYKRLYDLLNLEDLLFVCALYTRRGGIDICPCRWNNKLPVSDAEKLLDVTVYAVNNLKQ